MASREISIGKVSEVNVTGRRAIVSVTLEIGNIPDVKIGDRLLFAASGEYLIAGFKHWPENKMFDLLFEELKIYPSKDETVSLIKEHEG